MVKSPFHLLEMKTEIGLDPDPITTVELLYEEIKADDIPLGLTLIEFEPH